MTIDRPSTPQDWAAIREICVETSPRPVPPDEREAFGERWIGPYERWEKDWAYAARADGKVVGYLTGCASSLRFSARLLWAPRPLVGPNKLFPLSLTPRLWREYPAHLHVNVREGYRGGLGRALVSAFERDLAAAGVPGVHVFCGAVPEGFYRKLGFTPLAETKVGDAPVYAFGKRLKIA